MNLTDRYYLARATLIGDCRTLDQAHEALLSLVEVLRGPDLSPSVYDGLLTAIDIVSTTLGQRSDFLREMAEGGEA